MIHFIKEGEIIRLGLNIKRTEGGFSMLWAWFDVVTSEVIHYRFRFRSHIKPRFIWKKHRYNVVDEYIKVHDLTMINREILDDMIADQPVKTVYRVGVRIFSGNKYV